ncbi:ANM_HP_G0214850.mRNA.1.CDS.1 [Saccharomyces cerevisiae]|nr:ANM_HP_G0141760.mRNA.1.CDS.1 [Saccharomyces cerevisiae]CAI4995820.1 ANM_HP_G0158570.mRNA.1.CDS.1 [Saccharomyces cerevisiae]CAI5083210.1 ANM_HP_G0209910.mRNA.1.CDS.1 [Saccharomyces cerevisiae]CAI5098002.1 ANM_HP_G0214850.mRNA.1.CDS.1 [Saccharomyces cerevisiae]CAI6759538.1 ANM_HP_G0141760.mRNA.1.CDS.1 [Saccharomyces cerevisiae]
MIRLIRTLPLRCFKTRIRRQGSLLCLRCFSSYSKPLLQKSMSLKNIQLSDLSSSPLSKNKEKQEKPEKENEGKHSIGLLDRFSEDFITQGNGLKPTTSQNQLDTIKFYQMLRERGNFSDEQCKIIIALLLQLLNDQFYSCYNDLFLRDMELNKQSHLFSSLETELKFAIQNSRDTQLNENNLQLLKLKRELNSIHDELNEIIIDLLQKDAKLEFNNQKLENTLLYRQLNLKLNDCSNKIQTKILGDIRSHIENLRWQTTRNGLLVILVLVCSIMIGVSASKKERPGLQEPEEPEILAPKEDIDTTFPQDQHDID